MPAKLVEQAGFEAVYMPGGGTALDRLGVADLGLITMTEMAENAAAIAQSVSVPVIADADTGFGNALNVQRTVRAFERAGVAAIHLEDQVFPKRCGHFSGKSVIPIDEAVQKIRAAVEAWIASGGPFDRAGAYAIQDAAFQPVERYDGCYCNVVGLPLWPLLEMLRKVELPVEVTAKQLLPQCTSCPFGPRS